jgi:uncharacterized membrane protein YphA (DoxX/SURF4 family)
MKRGAFAIRLFLAAIFLYSGLVKASGSAQFAIALAPFAMIPNYWIHPLSILLPLAEIVGGIFILVSRTKTVGACLLLMLCLVFVAALGWALANGIIVDCSCFGQEQRPSAPRMTLALVRDAFLAMLAIIVLIKDR